MTDTARWIELEGAHNVRDLGGLPAGDGRTKRGVLFRADALDALTPSDVDLLTKELGLVHVVDLRSDAERSERGRGLLGARGVTYSELTIVDDQALVRRRKARAEAYAGGVDPIEIMVQGYVQLLELGGPAFAAAVDRLAAPGGTPALVHCAAGKDRTGVLIALLLELAGVERSVVVADYAVTNERMDRVVGRLQGADRFQQLADQIPAFVFEAQAATMEGLLTQLDERWGGAAGFLAEHGLPADTAERWRALFVDGG